MLASLNSVSACAWAHSPGLTHLPRQHTWRVQTFCQSKGKDQGKDRRTKRSGLAQLLANVLGLPPPGWYQSLSDAVASVQSQQQDFQSQQQDFQSQLQTFQSQINGVESQLKVDIPQMKADLAAVVNNQSASAEAAVRRQLSQTHRWRSDLCAAASIRTAGDAAKLLSGQLGFAELACIDQWLANVTEQHFLDYGTLVMDSLQKATIKVPDDWRITLQHARDMIKSTQENGWASGWDAKPLKTVGHILQTQGNEASDNRTRSFYREQVNLMLRYGYLQKQGKPVQGHVSSHMFIQLVATAAGLDSILPELEMDLQPLVTLTAPNARITIKLMVGEAKLTYTKAAAGKAREQMQRQLTILKWLCDVLLPGAVQQMEGTMWVATETRSPLPSHLGKMQDMNLNVRLV